MAFLSSEEKRRVAEAVARAESKTSGEIAVHVTQLGSPKDILAQARALFFELGLHETKRRNGVLILIAAADRKFAIWGDEGIHQAAGQPLWDAARDALAAHFAAGRFGEGLEAAVAEVGKALAAHFPREDGDLNELSDEVSES